MTNDVADDAVRFGVFPAQKARGPSRGQLKLESRVGVVTALRKLFSSSSSMDRRQTHDDMEAS